jgi:uncharacterized protein
VNKNIEIAKSIRAAIQQGDESEVLKLIGSDEKLVAMMTPFGTWLHVAVSFGKLGIVKRLVEVGCNVNARGGTFNGNALNIAASYGHLDIVNYLLSVGAEIDVSEPERNPLFGAIYGGHVCVAKLLVERGMDIQVKYTGESMKNMDALAFAQERGQKEIADLLGSAARESKVPGPH